MGRPANAKIWNEDLVAALEARAEMARQNGQQRHHLWSEGARIIQGVRQDIYTFKNGRIVGLPENKLKKTVSELCRSIICGSEQVFPFGYVAPDYSGNDSEVLTNDHYLNRIKIRGGAFAILMAFYTRGFPALTQEQICAYAQPFCDEPMQANFMGGRPHGAWSSNKTLQSHQLLLQQKPRAQFTALRGGGHGFRTAYGARAMYSLTDKGKLFVKTLLEKRPAAKQEMEHHRADSYGTGDAGTFGMMAGRGDMDKAWDVAKPLGPGRTVGSIGNIVSPPRATYSSAGSDEQDLRQWVQSAVVGDSRTFNVSKARRMDLHHVCDELSHTVLQALGRRLHHASFGSGRNRTLKVTVERIGEASANGGSELALDSPIGTQMNFSEPRLTSACGYGTPPKRARTANEAAAEAAMFRAALHESSMMAQQPKSKPGLAGKQLYSGTRLPAHATRRDTLSPEKHRTTVGEPAKPIILDESDDDSDDAWLHSPTIKRTAGTRKLDRYSQTIVVELSDSSDDDGMNAKSKVRAKRLVNIHHKLDDSVIDLTDELANRPVESVLTNSDAIETNQPKLKVYIDSRERNKNATPRHLRLELLRLLNTGPVHRVWSSSMTSSSVEERRLARGDFSFQFTLKDVVYQIPMAIERKTIADLVQRSVNGDHWKQLCQMRDAFNLGVFLLEGDLRSAVQFTAYGAQDDEGTFSAISHKIDDMDSLIRFIGRAVLSTPSFRLIQTDHEQGSLRAVATFGLMSLHHYVKDASQLSVPIRKLQSQASAKQQLLDRLQSGGIPWQIAKCVANEVGSISQMNKMFECSEEEYCRDALFAHLLDDICRKETSLTGTAANWSRAIHRVFFSPLSVIEKGRQAFEDYREIVADQAMLLINIHSGASPQEALDKSLANRGGEEEQGFLVTSRLVHIDVPQQLKNIFPQQSDQAESFCRINVVDNSLIFPMITITSRSDCHASARLCISCLEGDLILSRILKALGTDRNYVEVAKMVAENLYKDCSICLSHNDRLIMLFRGLSHAVGKLAKRPGYVSEIPVVVDMVLAQLSIAHGVVVLQAVHVKDDQEIIIQQLALACYRYQPLLYRIT